MAPAIPRSLEAIERYIGGASIKLGHLFPALVEPVARAVERGFGVAVHAMGNVGVESALAQVQVNGPARQTAGQVPGLGQNEIGGEQRLARRQANARASVMRVVSMHSGV